MEEDQITRDQLACQSKPVTGRRRKRKGIPMKLNLKAKQPDYTDSNRMEDWIEIMDEPLDLALPAGTSVRQREDEDNDAPLGSDLDELDVFTSNSGSSTPAYNDTKACTWNPSSQTLIASLELLKKETRITEEDVTIGETYVCQVCDKVYNQKRSYQAHLRYSHQGPEQSFVCSYCNFATPIRGNWLNHLAETHRKDPEGNPLQPNIKCPECDFTCVTKRRLKSHAYWKHATDKKHKCTDCDYSAISKCDLEKHVSIVHIGERPYECEKCGFRSKTVSALNSHMRAHTGVRRYQCQLCDKAYTHGAQLKLHMYNHSKDVKPFTCHMCAYSTHRRDYLQQHVRRIHVNDRIHISESLMPN